jgi:hypothetical protein
VGIPGSVPFRSGQARTLRETRTENPAREPDSQRLNLSIRKRDTMEIIKGVHDLAFVVVLIAIAMAPRAIDAYLTVRNGKITTRLMNKTNGIR